MKRIVRFLKLIGKDILILSAFTLVAFGLSIPVLVVSYFIGYLLSIVFPTLSILTKNDCIGAGLLVIIILSGLIIFTSEIIKYFLKKWHESGNCR